MRLLATILLTGLALGASAAEAWRWRDANGVIHYSDVPVPGAERIQLGSVPRPSGNAPAAAPATPASQGIAPAAQPDETPATVPYLSCVVTSPANDEVFNAVSAVTVSLQLEPALQEGHRVQAFLNSRVVPDWPEGVLNHTLSSLYRGTYSFGVRIVDAGGRPVCTSPSIKFHVRQPSVLSPARRPPAR